MEETETLLQPLVNPSHVPETGAPGHPGPSWRCCALRVQRPGMRFPRVWREEPRDADLRGANSTRKRLGALAPQLGWLERHPNTPR